MTCRMAAALLCALLTAPLIVAAQAAPDASRLQEFETQLETHASATSVLQNWCDAHAPGQRVVARQVQSAFVPTPEAARRALAIKPGEAVRYHRVQLMCGNRVLSNADNWYLPDKLTRIMNDTLEHSETPFGVAVAALHFTRDNLETTFPPPDDQGVLRHSAVLLTDKGQPFSFVVETYTKAVLGN